MPSPPLTVEITVISGEDLRIDRKPVKKKTFTTVKINSQFFDGGGALEIYEQDGNYPFWNQKMVLEMPVDVEFLTVEVHCRTSTGCKIIGTAIVPVTDFLGRYKPENYLHLLSYRLRDSKGERNGVVNISVKVKVPESAPHLHEGIGDPVTVTEMETKTSIYGCNDDGIVIGVPVSSAYSNIFG